MAVNGRCSGRSTAVGVDGEQAANTHVALDGFEALVDFRVGGTLSHCDFRVPPVDRPRLAGSAAVAGCGRRTGQQCCDLPQQRGSRSARQPDVRACGWARRSSGAPPLPPAPSAGPARQEARNQTAHRSCNTGWADRRRAPVHRRLSSCKRSSRRRERAGRPAGIHAGHVAVCTSAFAPEDARPVTAGTTAQARSRASYTCTPGEPVVSSAYRPRGSVDRTAAASGRRHTPEQHRLAGRQLGARHR